MFSSHTSRGLARVGVPLASHVLHDTVNVNVGGMVSQALGSVAAQSIASISLLGGTVSAVNSNGTPDGLAAGRRHVDRAGATSLFASDLAHQAAGAYPVRDGYRLTYPQALTS